MIDGAPRSGSRTVRAPRGAGWFAAALPGPRGERFVLDSGEGFDEPWKCGRLVALQPRGLLTAPSPEHADAASAFAAVEALLQHRRTGAGGAGTGIALLIAYDALDPQPAAGGEPSIRVLAVDASLRPCGEGTARLEWSADADNSVREPGAVERRLDAPAYDDEPDGSRIAGRPRSSLPRPAYLNAVERIKRHIRDGDIYQANLCQIFSAPCTGDPFVAWRAMLRATPAPRSAFWSDPRCTLASVSPEVFLDAEPDGRIRTWPIKGTRPRAADPADDQRVAAALLASEKDRAELLMIVDLERNDLGRICRTGSVRVPQLAVLRRFPAVHHLVACVEGRLRSGVGVEAILRATFPGGSISGAPKIRARQILAGLEPAPRGFFTGSLFWFPDAGGMESSILIRSPFFVDGELRLGAGGGIVADSDPEAEWQESNVKARALARALGFDPEEAR